MASLVLVHEAESRARSETVRVRLSDDSQLSPASEPFVEGSNGSDAFTRSR